MENLKTRTATAFLIAFVVVNIPGPTIHYVKAGPVPEVKAPVVQDHTVVLAEVTKYNSDHGQTDADPLITANGNTVGPGTIACPGKIPFGTKIEINKKTYFCNDRMGPRYRKGNYYDVWTPSRNDAIAWGRKTVEVKIYK